MLANPLHLGPHRLLTDFQQLEIDQLAYTRNSFQAIYLRHIHAVLDTMWQVTPSLVDTMPMTPDVTCLHLFSLTTFSHDYNPHTSYMFPCLASAHAISPLQPKKEQEEQEKALVLYQP
jgi:hypothetical protein